MGEPRTQPRKTMETAGEEAPGQRGARGGGGGPDSGHSMGRCTGAQQGAGGAEAVVEPCPSPPADHAERLGADGHQLWDQGEHPHCLPGGCPGRHGGHLHGGGSLWGSPEPGFLPLHVPAGAAPAVEISHFRGRADLGIFHRRRSRLRPVLWYAEAHVHPGAVGTGCARGRRAAGVLALPVPHTEGSPAHVRWLCPADAIQFYSNGTLAASGPLETASIFATYPAEYLSLSNGFLDQVMGTALLIVGILAITDARNKRVPEGLEPVAVALLVFSIEVSMGSNCGCPMNPARDFGPRLFTYVAGWGAEVFRWVGGDTGKGLGAARTPPR
uniref:Aquaporin 10 n=1 Tax=Cairina moschata TaxID=8855 RepID=A0A8C3BKA1_CAIMO